MHDDCYSAPLMSLHSRYSSIDDPTFNCCYCIVNFYSDLHIRSFREPAHRGHGLVLLDLLTGPTGIQPLLIGGDSSHLSTGSLKEHLR